MSSEGAIQLLLMKEVMLNKKHIAAVPNSTVLLVSEADMLSVTKARYVHEYEIKISMADYRRELFSKKNGKLAKHGMLKYLHERKSTGRISAIYPNYFWFVTYELEIEPPPYAGWILVTGKNLEYKKSAPRLHKQPWPERKVSRIAKLLSFRLMDRL